MVRRLSLALVMLLGVLLVGGCGGSSTSASPLEELSSLAGVAETSAGSRTGRFELHMTQSFPGADDPFAFSAEGAFDVAAKRVRLTFDMSSLAKLLTAFGGGGQQLGDPGDWTLDAVQDGTVVYVRFPFLHDRLPAGKTWIRADVGELAAASGASLDFDQLANSDPRKVLEYLKAATDGVKAVGRERVRGVETTHYVALIDLAKHAKTLLQSSGGLAGFEDVLKQAGLGQLPIGVWVGDDQLVRKVELTYAFAPAGQDARVEATIVAEYYDYGAPVEIDLPLADETVDASALER